MDKIFEDVSKLSQISDMFMGQEKWSATVEAKDFLNYYFNRFKVNFANRKKDFSVSEIRNFNNRHVGRIATVDINQQKDLSRIIVPIPKGMLKSYKQTLDGLLAILAGVHPERLKDDLNLLLQAMTLGNVTDLSLVNYSKKEFDAAKISIGKLFGKVGLTHATGDHVLISYNESAAVNETLLQTTDRFYPDVIAFNTALKDLETQYYHVDWSEKQKKALSVHFMTLAYRLSIFATVMEHIQDVEHNFTKCFEVITK